MLCSKISSTMNNFKLYCRMCTLEIKREASIKYSGKFIILKSLKILKSNITRSCSNHWRGFWEKELLLDQWEKVEEKILTEHRRFRQCSLQRAQSIQPKDHELKEPKIHIHFPTQTSLSMMTSIQHHLKFYEDAENSWE